MKHQIALVGGQLLPIYIGIMEFVPDKIHLIVSNESKEKINSLRPFLAGKAFSEYSCDPFAFSDIKAVCEKVINKIDPADEISFNLTGGTKIMVLAVQSIIHEKNLKGFYINPDNSLLELPSYSQRPLLCTVTIKEFLELSGHGIYSYKTIADFSSHDFIIAKKIMSFCVNDYRYKTIIGYISRTFKDSKTPIPNSGSFVVGKKTTFKWFNETIEIHENNKLLYTFSSKLIKNLFFNSSWWELIVAQEISKWQKTKELFIQCELPFKTDSLHLKNEIDILINIGTKLIFVECKSGRVKQEDINKMKIVKDTYGGIISKSILVCMDMPSPGIVEKCKELNIEIFYLFMGKMEVNPIDKILSVLDKLAKKLSV
jgi:hypothetical protein